MNKYKSVGLARMVLDGRHVQNFSYVLDDAVIAAQFTAAGMPAKLYGGKREGRVLDLARQLVRMRTDAYLFWISAATAGPMSVLATELKRLRPDTDIIFWGDMQGANPTVTESVTATGQFHSSTSIDETISFFTGAPVNHDERVSPYASGLLAHSEMPRLGLDGNQLQQTLIAELQILHGADFGNDVIIPLHATACGSLQLLDLVKAAEECATMARFELHAMASDLSEEFLQALRPAKFARVLAHSGNMRVIPVGSNIEVPIIAYGDLEKDQRAAIYGSNGSVALHAGFYFDAKQTAGIYHIEVPMSMPVADRAAVYKWAASSMDIRSAAVLTGSAKELAANAESFVAPLSLETNGWPKHTYALERELSGEGALSFDANARTRQKVNYVALGDLHLSAPTDTDSITYVSIKTSRDADELERRLEIFHTSGEMVINNPRTAQLIENSCRWMEYGACRLPLLRRVAVDTSMRLSSCRDAGDIGKIGDDYDQIVIRVKQQVQLEEIRRECATCSVRDKCSHCSQLPSEWGGRYCSLRRSYQQTSLYLEMHKFTQSFLKAIPPFDQDAIVLGVSYTGLPAKYYKGKPGIAREGHRPVMVRVLNQDLVWWRGTQKIRRLSPPLVAMAEAWWVGAEHNDIVEALMHDFEVDRDMATSSLQQGLEKLKDEGIIHA